jgi:phosphoglycolate phosphatase
LSMTVEQAGGEASRSVMIGDSKTDIDTARHAGVPVIGVNFGYSDIPIDHLNPDHVIGHYDALYGAVTALIAKTAS